ncbi:hypothetical protein [Microcoleus sp. FACHB-672]|uniref:hypothetical protein n=1 Tax=Microcoleus sp. FACHB-672 TaxID=2692825 RepID=UPI0016859ECC|nr:hypothetical protein [Microcoleus sp. FACHB-672]MBD2041061.1 hypothetical protein [Microcoleus sp. FACHB-672]
MTVNFRHSVVSHNHWACKKLLSGNRQLQWGIFWIAGFWLLGGTELRAETEHSISSSILENWNLSSSLRERTNSAIARKNLDPNFSEPVTPASELENVHPALYKKAKSVVDQKTLQLDRNKGTGQAVELESFQLEPQSSLEKRDVALDYPLNSLPILIAGPENFNPKLRLPPPPPPEPPKPPPEAKPASTEPKTESEPANPFAVLENLQIDFRDDKDNYGQHNQIIEPTFQFGLQNGQKIRFRTGWNTFDQSYKDDITNIPLQIGWEGKIGTYNLRVAGGVDLFSRLPTALNFNAQVDKPIFTNLSPAGNLDSGLFLTGMVEQGPYKFNAQTLENLITAWRFGPNIYWQIDRYTSFFSLYRFGFYNDGNYEQQSFSRLERKIEQFFLAANLFTWSYENDPQKGYFSPPDFLVYNGEVGWEGNIFKFLKCRLFANLGKQRLNGKIDDASTYQARCTTKISPNVEADFGYGYSNVRNAITGESAYNNRSLTGQLRVKF